MSLPPAMLRSFDETLASELTLEQQTIALDHVIERLDRCLGNTSRDVNRAVYLAAQMLGVPYKKFFRLIKIARLFGSKKAVADHPNWITIGQPGGSVYYAADFRGNRLKIGFSLSPPDRIATVTMRFGIPLVEFYRESGFMFHEHVRQVEGRTAWLGGEWFDADLFLAISQFQHLAPEFLIRKPQQVAA